jgi:hypothetical protein
VDDQTINANKSHTIKDLLIVASILSIIFVANLAIIERQREVQTNYYAIPDEISPYFQQRVIYLALEKNFTSVRYNVDIRDMDKNIITMDTVYCVEFRDGKYIHTANYTHWTTWKANTTYRFFFAYRSWWSPPFQVNETGFYFLE